MAVCCVRSFSIQSKIRSRSIVAIYLRQYKLMLWSRRPPRPGQPEEQRLLCASLVNIPVGIGRHKTVPSYIGLHERLGRMKRRSDAIAGAILLVLLVLPEIPTVVSAGSQVCI